jgi:hypothetical protein
MYNLIKQIIDHTMSSNYSYEEQYIYFICGALVVLICLMFFDSLRTLFRRLIGK